MLTTGRARTLDDLDTVVTDGRSHCSSRTFQPRTDRLNAAVRGKRILSLAAADRSARLRHRLIADLEPAALHVIDQSENYLAELVRDLRGRQQVFHLTSSCEPCRSTMAARLCSRLLADEAPYDAVLNFAALKHVRSEKDVYSVLQMLDTNIVKHIRFKRWLADGGHGPALFAGFY